MDEKLEKFASNKNITIVLSVLILIIPSFMLPYDYTIFKTIAMARAIITIIAGLILSFMLIIRHKELRFDKIDVVLFIFYVLGWISTFLAVNIKVAFIGDVARYDGIIMLTMYFIIYYCSKNFYIYFKGILSALILMATLLCSIVILQSFKLLPLGNHFVIPYNSAQPAATLMNSNIFGSYITLFLPIILCLYLLKGEKKYLVFSIIAFSATFCCMVRSAWIAFAFDALIVFIYLIYKKNTLLWQRALILFIGFIISLSSIIIIKSITGSLPNKLNTIVSETKSIANTEIKDSMGSGRILLWKMAVQGIIDHPLTGYGPSNYLHGTVNEQKENVKKYYDSHHKIENKAHNEYLELAVTLGIPALIMYLIALFLILNVHLRNIFKNKFSLIVILSIGGYLVQAIFSISVISVAPIFWFILGICGNKKFIDKAEKEL